MSDPHRKRIKHFHEPGDCHELTFSCFERRPLLSRDSWRKLLCSSIDSAITKQRYKLVAFVLMPEHVHLLVYPVHPDPRIGTLLSHIKRPFSYRIKKQLQEEGNPLLETLTVQERPNKTSFRFWQEGPGFDRNFFTETAIRNAIEYIHMNPVRRGLAERARDWKWSSAAWFESEGTASDSDLPTVHGPPWGLLTQ